MNMNLNKYLILAYQKTPYSALNPIYWENPSTTRTHGLAFIINVFHANTLEIIWGKGA